MAGSEFHQTEYFGPVLGIMTARTLEEAIALQNGSDYGLTAGIHSLDPEEVRFWLDRVQAGNCYVNRGITGAIVRRQPFGGWKKSSVGAGAKAGGPNYLFGLGSWRSKPAVASVPQTALDPYLVSVADVVERESNTEISLNRALASDHVAWTEEYSASKDPSGVGVERNVFRYHAGEVTLRFSGFSPMAQIVRVILAGLRAGARFNISSSDDPRTSFLSFCGGHLHTWERSATTLWRPNRRLPAEWPQTFQSEFGCWEVGQTGWQLLLTGHRKWRFMATKSPRAEESRSCPL